MDKTEGLYAQVKLSARKTVDERFVQTVHVKNKLEEFFYLLHVLISVFDEVIII